MASMATAEAKNMGSYLLERHQSTGKAKKRGACAVELGSAVTGPGVSAGVAEGRRGDRVRDGRNVHARENPTASEARCHNVIIYER
jgi:hypothetical protein